METMKGFALFLSALLFSSSLFSQEKCASAAYQQEQLSKNSSIASRINAIEKHTTESGVESRIISEGTVIKIPVVVHILYRTPDEKITDAQVISQIDALNKYFRRRNADTMNAPPF